MPDINPHSSPVEVGIVPILLMRKLRLREVKKVVQDPKLLIGRAEIPISSSWLQNPFPMSYTILIATTSLWGSQAALGAALIQKPPPFDLSGNQNPVFLSMCLSLISVISCE